METIHVVSAIAYVLIISLGIYIKTRIAKAADIAATNKNFGILKDQLDETTRIAKTIESEITNDAWVIQQKWQLRKEFYLESLSYFHEISCLFNLWFISKAKFETSDNEEYKKNFELEMSSAYDSIEENQLKLNHQLEKVGVLFLEQKMISIIRDFTRSNKDRVNKILLNSVDGIRHSSTFDIEKAREQIKDLSNLHKDFLNAHKEFLSVAKADLNLELKKYSLKYGT
jgi:hypothetical protein